MLLLNISRTLCASGCGWLQIPGVSQVEKGGTQAGVPIIHDVYER